MNGLSNTPASYLPSRRSQLVSQNRIAKINELYEQKQRQHQDSVVSNNSTSVVSEDNCVPIRGLTTYRIQGQYNVDEPSTTVKHEELPSTFATNTTKNLQEQEPEDNTDEDYEDELKFTPKLKSRRSLLTMRKNFEQEANSPISNDEPSPMEDVSTPLPKVRRRVGSLRKSLGDPLPLPYLPRDSSPIHKERREPVSQSPHLVSPSNVDKKRQIMESKWRKLVSQDKSMLESRLKELRRPSLPTTMPPPRPDSPTLVPQKTSTSLPNPPPQSLEELQQEIISNRQRLDEIIVLLNQKQKPSLQFPSLNFHYRWNESTFWTLCIIALILCNFYVYYYL
ncbi:hypothetical protein ZYGR_0I04150 [Zygosaccharomyces rouxii]|uniref:ZYRO0C09922p n=2 Tax=Zygosaccharomyces rouxii TaxID=4956 RepID=C5DTN2_ZYGRC|nr:uncharacterized protein ZYRO0C09922g [Zygosaccharomyces rouxii]KAH9201679.1 hypothetical protein LQ764DRAFT_83343 [Zygosaccharomyces rouxii]GAV48118.1 hypothetical protein ZYGR_0I04150 [Zygosaccharomyces rouxii]CAR27143.1 ZYRO0C09922p [Zygosaccharomyces rouxii]